MRDIPPSGVTPAGGRRGSGRLAVLGRPRTQSRDHRTLEIGTSFAENCGGMGRARSQPERFDCRGKSAKGKPRSEPDSGDPTVRDRRGARGDMAMGVGLRPTAKAVDEPPNPKARAPRIYPDRLGAAAKVRRVPGYTLWLGHVGDARDLSGLLSAGITAVVDLALNEAPVPLARELVYCRFPLIDGGGNPRWLLRTA